MQTQQDLNAELAAKLAELGMDPVTAADYAQSLGNERAVAALAKNQANRPDGTYVPDLDLGHGNIAEAFDDAFALAQRSFAPIHRNREVTVRIKPEKGGGSYVFKYAELSTILEATVPHLNDHGISFRQRVEIDEKGHWVVTQLRYKGYRVEDRFPVQVPTSNHPQDYGAGVTYAKRLGAQCSLGVVGEDDNDGEGPDTGNLQAQPKQRAAQPGKTRTELKEEIRKEAQDIHQPATKLSTKPAPEFTEQQQLDLDTMLTDVSDEMLQAAAEGRRVGIEQIWNEISSQIEGGADYIKTKLWNYMQREHPDHFVTMKSVLKPDDKKGPRGPKPNNSVPA